MRDYRKRYQAIKDKGRELGVTIDQVINKEKFLYFKNNHVADYSTIPLEDYLSIEASDTDIASTDNKRFPLLTILGTIGKIADEKSPFKALGYGIVLNLGEGARNEKGELEPSTYFFSYLPIELSLLLNPFNEATIEETLARYLIALFKPKKKKEELIELIKKDFDKYAFIYSAYFGNGYLKGNKRVGFERLISSCLKDRSDYSEWLLKRNGELKKQISNIIGNKNPFTGELLPEAEEVFSSASRDALNLYLDENNNATPSYEDLIEYETPGNKIKLKFAFSSITFLTSQENERKELIKMSEEIKEVIYNKELLASMKATYRTLSYRTSGAERFKELAEIEDEGRKLPASGGVRDLFNLRLIIEKKSEENYREKENELKAVDQEIAQIDEELEEVNKSLEEKGQRGEFNTLPYKILVNKKVNLITERDKKAHYKETLGENGRPYNYFIFNNNYYFLSNIKTRLVQINEIENLLILGKNLKAILSHVVIFELENNNALAILLFLLSVAVKQCSNEITITNEEVEQEILGAKIEEWKRNNPGKKVELSESERNHARNDYFYSALHTLSRIVLVETKGKDEEALGLRKQGAIVSDFDITTDPNRIVLNRHFFEEWVNLQNDYPISKNIRKLSNRAKICAYYLHELFFFKNSDKGNEEDEEKSKEKTLRFESFSKLSIYSGGLKYLKGNNTKPKRFFTPILEDLEEMKQAGILTAYTPTLEDYKNNKITLSSLEQSKGKGDKTSGLDYVVTLHFQMKPLKRKWRKKAIYNKA